MSISKFAMGALSICTVIAMAGCGGGSSSSSSGSTSLPALNVPEANATVSSGTEAASIVVGTNYTGGLGVLSASSTSGATFNPVAYVKNKVFKHNGITINSVQAQPAATQTQTVDCYDANGNVSGSMTVSASMNDAGTSLSGSVVYNQCDDYGYAVLNGTINIAETGNFNTYTLSTANMSFPTDFTVTSSGITETIHQGTYVNDAFTTYDDTNYLYAGTETSSLWIDDGEMNYRYDNLTTNFDEDDYNGVMKLWYQSGRIYVANLTAYLDIDSTYDTTGAKEFVWNYGSLSSGSMQLLGSNGSTVLVAADGSGGYTVTVQ